MSAQELPKRERSVGRFNMTSRIFDAGEPDMLFRIKLNSILMLHARGYVIPNDESSLYWSDYLTEYHAKLAAFNALYKQVGLQTGQSNVGAMTRMYDRRDGTGRVFVKFMDFFKDRTEIDIKSIRIAVDQCKTYVENKVINKVILVVPGKLSSPSGKVIHASKLPIEIVMWDKLLVNPMASVLDAKYEPLNGEQAAQFYKKNNLSAEMLPQFYLDDPVMFWNDWQRGQLVRIFREDFYTNSVNKISVTYRAGSNAIRK